MIQRIMGLQFSRVASAAFLIGGFSVFSRLLGLVRNRIFTSEFGAGQTLDVYYAAFLIPDFIYNLFVLGLLSAVFIPIFSEYFHKDKKEAWHFANVSLNALIILISALSVILYFAMPWLLSFLVSGFSEDMKAEAIKVSRLMLLSPVILGVSSIFGSIVQNFRKYIYYSIAPMFYNIGIILGAVFLGQSMGAYGLAIGVVVGALFHLFIQVAGAFSAGFEYKMMLDFKHLGFVKMGKLSIGRFLSMAASQINFMVLVSIGSFLSLGSIAVFNLANDIQFIPIGVIALSYAVAIFPKLSEASVKKEIDDFSSELSRAMTQILFFVVPISILFIMLKNQVVDILYGLDSTGSSQNILIAATLAVFSLSIFTQSLIPIFNRAYYALQDTITPFFTNFVSILVNIVLSFSFIALFNARGTFYNILVNVLNIEDIPSYMVVVLSLPLAFSLGSILNCVLLIYFLKDKVGILKDGQIIRESFKIFIASLFIIPVSYSALYFISLYISLNSYLHVFIETLLVVAISISAYIVALRFLKSKEATFFKTMASSIMKTSFRKSKEGLPANIEEELMSSKEQ